MRTRLMILLLVMSLPPVLCLRSGQGQSRSADIKNKVDAAVLTAYQSAVAGFPCSLKSGGKPRMFHWDEVDRCLNNASRRIDWDALAAQFESLRSAERGMAEGDFSLAVEASLSAHAVPFEKVFSAKDKDADALLPLTNSLLKYLPPDAFQDLAVFDKAGTLVGTFSGTYSYERSGGLSSANTYRLVLFQYMDRDGDVLPVAEKLLLDSFGTPWKDARGRGAFRLNSDKLFPAR